MTTVNEARANLQEVYAKYEPRLAANKPISLGELGELVKVQTALLLALSSSTTEDKSESQRLSEVSET